MGPGTGPGAEPRGGDPGFEIVEEQTLNTLAILLGRAPTAPHQRAS